MFFHATTIANARIDSALLLMLCNTRDDVVMQIHFVLFSDYHTD